MYDLTTVPLHNTPRPHGAYTNQCTFASDLSKKYPYIKVVISDQRYMFFRQCHICIYNMNQI